MQLTNESINIIEEDISDENFVQENSEMIDFDNGEYIEGNSILVISEKKRTVLLPYTKDDLQKYYEQFPKSYRDLRDVIQKQFVLPIDYFKYYSVSRFREGYSLLRNREGRPVFDSLKFGMNLMFKYNLHPAIITACKTEEDLNEYLKCLDNDKTKEFNKFVIKFEVTPLKV